MASCHPCGISVFPNGLVPSAITINSQSRPGGKKKHKHVQLNLYFWRPFLHFCKYILTSLQSFKAVKKTFIAFIKKLCIFDNFELMTFYHVQGPKSCNFDIDKNRFK